MTLLVRTQKEAKNMDEKTCHFAEYKGHYEQLQVEMWNVKGAAGKDSE